MTNAISTEDGLEPGVYAAANVVATLSWAVVLFVPGLPLPALNALLLLAGSGAIFHALLQLDKAPQRMSPAAAQPAPRVQKLPRAA